MPAARSRWEGFLRIGLISVPVRAFSAVTPGEGDFHFNQIHKGCGERLHYQKVCPVHGEVAKEEVISGYEYEKGKYLEIEPSEVKNLRAENDEAIDIQSFVAPDLIEPVFYRGSTFYLVPDGAVGAKPFTLLHRVMQEKKRSAVARIILSGHEETVLIRPEGKVLAMSVLYFENQIKPASSFASEVDDVELSPEEIKLAGSLIDASTTKEVDFSQFKDLYNERIAAMIDAKLAGKKPETKHHEKRPAVINLMDALKKSLEKTQEKSPKRTKARTVKRAHAIAGGHKKRTG